MNAILINTARGEVVDALLAALTNGRLLRAALNSFASDPLYVDSRLLQLDNVVVTLRIGGRALDNVKT